MDDFKLKRILEALLLSHPGPLSLEKMRAVFDEGQRPSNEQLQSKIEELRADYASLSFDLMEVAGGYVMQTRAEYGAWIERLHYEKPVKYSRALLETLAIIAYKQPVTRSDIEGVRGVAVNSQIMKTLLERDWIESVGFKDLPGKPALYCTTQEFLNYFNLKGLNQLPVLEEP